MVEPRSRAKPSSVSSDGITASVFEKSKSMWSSSKYRLKRYMGIRLEKRQVASVAELPSKINHNIGVSNVCQLLSVLLVGGLWCGFDHSSNVDQVHKNWRPKRGGNGNFNLDAETRRDSHNRALGETLGSRDGRWEGLAVSDGTGEVIVQEGDGENTTEAIPVIGATEGGESVGTTSFNNVRSSVVLQG